LIAHFLIVAFAAATAAGAAPAADSRRGMIVTQQAIATDVGLEVLRAGGNAVDAAVAAAFALAVVHPQAGNLGGGGFMMFLRARDSLATCIDFRETAPARATRDVYLDARGEVDTALVRIGHASAGVPGTPAGLYLAWSKYGSRPWRSLIAPALKLAQDGFAVNEELARVLVDEYPRYGRFAASRDLFAPQGKPLRAGQKLVQKDLARTLRLLATSGPLTFYEGAAADLMVKEVARAHGLMTAADLAAYRAVERVPLRGRYRDLEILVPPPPSSGGITLLQMLSMLEPNDLASLRPASAARVHLAVEVMTRAFADRASYLGDPDFVRVPVAGLLAPAYLAVRRQGLGFDRATPGVVPGDAWQFDPEGRAPVVAPVPSFADTAGSTTHLSVVDAAGNCVALTTTLNAEMGSGVLVPGAGFLLNNEMDDFSAKPGAPNQFHLVGTETNAIAPGKRMLSSMTPAIVRRAGRPWLVLGSRGGPRIITAVMNVILDVRDNALPLRDAVAAPRFHHQWQPNLIWHEPGAFSNAAQSELERLGHTLRERSRYGGVNAIEIRADGTRHGVADPRSPGSAAGE
jgi:gamma-glutamyltranspeptidase/glutathione hydrolase